MSTWSGRQRRRFRLLAGRRASRCGPSTEIETSARIATLPWMRRAVHHYLHYYERPIPDQRSPLCLIVQQPTIRSDPRRALDRLRKYSHDRTPSPKAVEQRVRIALNTAAGLSPRTDSRPHPVPLSGTSPVKSVGSRSASSPLTRIPVGFVAPAFLDEGPEYINTISPERIVMTGSMNSSRYLLRRDRPPPTSAISRSPGWNGDEKET